MIKIQPQKYTLDFKCNIFVGVNYDKLLIIP